MKCCVLMFHAQIGTVRWYCAGPLTSALPTQSTLHMWHAKHTPTPPSGHVAHTPTHTPSLAKCAGHGALVSPAQRAILRVRWCAKGARPAHNALLCALMHKCKGKKVKCDAS